MGDVRPLLAPIIQKRRRLQRLPTALIAPHTLRCSAEDIEYFNAMVQICNASGPKSYENITREESKLKVQPTELRSNPVYYRIYYVHLNTIFASLIPLVSLLYLNIATVKALKKMVEVR